MKLSDFVAAALSIFTDHVFVVQGGAALHLIDSVHKCQGIYDIPMQHEQACAMAADAYAKAQLGIGATIATSGPGATNLLTGIACSYFDSVPTVHITGNVSSFRQSSSLGVRQYGFQETDIVSMAQPITKRAYQIASPEDILSKLPEAIQVATSGRNGPVLIDIPDDYQRVELDTSSCEDILESLKILEPIDRLPEADPLEVAICLEQLSTAKRPVFIYGSGISRPAIKEQYVILAEKLNIPFFVTWPNKGMAAGHRLNMGTFGTHSSRGNNVVLQNADVVFSVGCRMDSRATGKLDLFARKAVLGMVEIDAAEMDKFDKLGIDVRLKIHSSAESFVTCLSALIASASKPLDQVKEKWFFYIDNIRNKYNTVPAYTFTQVNPYQAAKQLSAKFKKDDIICVDTGTCLPLTLIYSEEKEGQRYLSSYNNSPMGYGLPAAIGVALQNRNNRVFSINGDGGLQMNIQELATVAALKLNITIVVYNNHGHAMIKQTQDDWLDSRYVASSLEAGLPSVNFKEISEGYSIVSFRVSSNDELEDILYNKTNSASPVLIELMIDDRFRCEPIVKYGNPLEAMSPTNVNAKIRKDMIITNVG
jgi:acetolactate synthase-1/2/3 large subunit